MPEGDIQKQIIVRAIKDPAFRQALLNNPRAVLAREYDFHLPEHVAVRVLEEPAPYMVTIVLPHREDALLELSDAELEEVAGGRGVAWLPANSGNCSHLALFLDAS